MSQQVHTEQAATEVPVRGMQEAHGDEANRTPRQSPTGALPDFTAAVKVSAARRRQRGGVESATPEQS